MAEILHDIRKTEKELENVERMKIIKEKERHKDEERDRYKGKAERERQGDG